MTRSTERPHLVCYDIADPKRLQRVHKYLSKHALALQYSVFIVRMTRETRETLRLTLATLINPREDDVRIYPLPRNPRIIGYGLPKAGGMAQLLEQGHDLLQPIRHPDDKR